MKFSYYDNYSRKNSKTHIRYNVTNDYYTIPSILISWSWCVHGKKRKTKVRAVESPMVAQQYAAASLFVVRLPRTPCNNMHFKHTQSMSCGSSIW